MSKSGASPASAAMPASAMQSSGRSRELAQLYALAVAQHKAGAAAEAIDTYRQCLALSPNSPEIHNNLGAALEQMGRLPEAVACFERALALDPIYVRPLVNLGKVLRLQGKASEALASLERALTISPNSAAALTNLGFVLTDLGRRHEAIQHLRQAIHLEPGLAEAHHALGLAAAYSGDTSAARDSLVRAITLKPDLLDAYPPLASSLVLLQQLPDALTVLDKYLEKRPKDQNALAVALGCSQHMCDWTRAQSTLGRIRSLPSETAHAQPFTMMGISDDPAEHLRAARIRAEAIVRDRVPMPMVVAHQHEKIRVAYVSSDFFTHATSFLIAELLELHDRSSFEIYGVSFGPNDGSALRKRVFAAFDAYVEGGDCSDLEIAHWLRECEIDVAVDLKGYTCHSRPGVFAHRAAPIQVNYLGYPGTMAAPFMDYIIADQFVIPEAEQQFYTEKVVSLPASYQVNDRRRRISERLPTRAQVGLPESAFVFCCFNNSWKITAPVFDIWMRLVAGVPDSVLWLLQDNRWAAENLRREAAARGIAPERLVFCGRASSEDHLARHRLADLFLDTFPYNAHTTASDALWTGLPLVTYSGRTFASRVAGSLLQAVGLPELVTTSPQEYERLALRLALERGELEAFRARLQSRHALPLFDTPMFCRHLEGAYRRMEALHRANRPPESFAIEDLSIGVRS